MVFFKFWFLFICSLGCSCSCFMVRLSALWLRGSSSSAVRGETLMNDHVVDLLLFPTYLKMCPNILFFRHLPFMWQCCWWCCKGWYCFTLLNHFCNSIIINLRRVKSQQWQQCLMYHLLLNCSSITNSCSLQIHEVARRVWCVTLKLAGDSGNPIKHPSIHEDKQPAGWFFPGVWEWSCGLRVMNIFYIADHGKQFFYNGWWPWAVFWWNHGVNQFPVS